MDFLIAPLLNSFLLILRHLNSQDSLSYVLL